MHRLPRWLTPERGAFALSALLGLVLLASWLPCRIVSCCRRGTLSHCDALFVALDAEIANGLDIGIDARPLAAQVLRAHADARNPRDDHAPAYVQGFDPAEPGFVGDSGPRACQVRIGPVGPDTILLVQAPVAADEGGNERRFRITAD